jgi:hydroxyethylthiazole kinase-like sugar kinase family protein
VLFDGWHGDYHTVSWSSATPTSSFVTNDVVLGAHMNVTLVVFVKPVMSAIRSRLHRWRKSCSVIAVASGNIAGLGSERG